ncbi:MAG TPA: amino acid ABC transporter substrate-binding protein [Nordella sp.]|nr:amino acid ABC transporter substrate-binding protein [Nordella sp.]
MHICFPSRAFAQLPGLARRAASAAVAMAALFCALPAQAETIKDIEQRGFLKCGVLNDYPGFGFLDNQGNYQGFDVDFCRAIAAALKTDVRYTRLDGNTRFPALASSEVDVVLMLVTDTMGRETSLKLDFPVMNFYDGQTYLVPKALNVTAIKELNGASICLTSGSTGEVNTADYFRSRGLTYKPVVFQKIEDAERAYAEGRCDSILGQAANLATLRANLSNPDDHLILPELISKEPMGPVTRGNDRQWSQAVKWIVNALLFAEERGVTQANVAEQVKSAADPEVRRMLGAEGALGADAGLPPDFAVRAIAAVGNYGEIFERNVGEGSRFKMKRGLNALWSQGGLHYPPPFK